MTGAGGRSASRRAIPRWMIWCRGSGHGAVRSVSSAVDMPSWSVGVVWLAAAWSPMEGESGVSEAAFLSTNGTQGSTYLEVGAQSARDRASRLSWQACAKLEDLPTGSPQPVALSNKKEPSIRGQLAVSRGRNSPARTLHTSSGSSSLGAPTSSTVACSLHTSTSSNNSAITIAGFIPCSAAPAPATAA